MSDNFPDGFEDICREAATVFFPMRGMRVMMRGVWCMLIPSLVDDTLVGAREKNAGRGLVRDTIAAYDIEDFTTVACMQHQVLTHPLVRTMDVNMYTNADPEIRVGVLTEESGVQALRRIHMQAETLGFALHLMMVKIREVEKANAERLTKANKENGT